MDGLRETGTLCTKLVHTLSTDPTLRRMGRVCAFCVVWIFAACGDDSSVPDTGGADTGSSCEGGCTTPPDSFCPGDGSIAMFESPGMCVSGTCEYPEIRLPCPMCPVCDPCEDVVCDTPPAADCDGGSMRTYSGPGTCDMGTCTYPTIVVPCPSGCADGECIP